MTPLISKEGGSFCAQKNRQFSSVGFECNSAPQGKVLKWSGGGENSSFDGGEGEEGHGGSTLATRPKEP